MERKIIGYFNISCEWNSFLPDEDGNMTGKWNGKLAFYNDNFCIGTISDDSNDVSHLVIGTIVPSTGISLTKIHKFDENHAPITLECSTIASGDQDHYFGRIYSVEFNEMKPVDLKGMTNLNIGLINLSESEKLEEQAKIDECLKSIEEKSETSKNKFARQHFELVEYLSNEDQLYVTDEIDRKFYEFNGLEEPNPFVENFEKEEEQDEFSWFGGDDEMFDDEIILPNILTNGGPMFNLAEEAYVKNKVNGKNTEDEANKKTNS